MRHYCTLFDSKYLPQGLVLYESLKKHSSESFTLHVLPMDKESAETLMDMVLPGVQVLLGFHDSEEMVQCRANRSHKEYCWSCASNLCETLLVEFGLPEITYLDADCYAFADLATVFKEIGERPIAVTPHRLIPSKQHLIVNGVFNVGLIHFKNDTIGRECVSTWAWQCRERCSETSGCGDQQYLDAFPQKYGHELCIIENIGVNAGPWSIGNWKVTEGPRLDGVPLILYHFHEYRHGELLTNYLLRDEDREIIYRPYIEANCDAVERIKASRVGVSLCIVL